MAEMSNHENCICDDLSSLPPPSPLHRQRCGVVGGQCINQGCSNYYPEERECQTCDECAERHCSCRRSVQAPPRIKRQRYVSDKSSDNKRTCGR